MKKSKKKKQQKLSAKRARKSAKRKTTAPRSRQDYTSQGLARISSYPIHETLISESLFKSGMGSGVFTRLIPSGDIALSFFLLDVFCLGVKDAHFAIVSMAEYDNFKTKTEETQHLVETEPECLVKLIFDAIDYAGDLGFPPHKDYHRAKVVFGTIQGDECDQTFEFGQDGKPFYIAGPSDTPVKIARIKAQLERAVGADGYHYMHEVEEKDLWQD